MSRLVGRPSRYTQTLAGRICGRLASGESLSAICADTTMPGYSTVMEWLDGKPDFRERYTIARTRQAHALADEVLDVLRTPDFAPADKQARIKGLTWMAGKMYPVKYADRPREEPPAEGDTPVFTVVVRQPEQDPSGRDAGIE